MSGRPNNPVVWSALANYPAGGDPWSGTTTVNAPAYSQFTPGLPPAAQEINYLLQGLGQSSSDILNFAGQMPAQNWKLPTSGLVGIDPFQSCAPSPYNMTFRQGWLFGTNVVSGGPIQSLTRSQDTGDSYVSTSVDTLATAWLSCLVSPNTGTSATDKATAVVKWDNATDNAIIYKFDTSTNTLSGGTTVAHGFFTEGYYLAGKYVLISPQSPSGSSAFLCYSSADLVTWTNRTPAGSPAVTFGWCSASSGSMIVALPRAQATGSQYFITTTDGVTWTVRAAASGFNGFQGVTWDSQNSLWVAAQAPVVASLPVAGTNTIWQSPDGINWTAVSSISSFTITGLSSIGCLLVANTLSGDLLCSVDAGVTWRLVGYRVPVSGTPAIGTNYLRPGVTTNGNRFVAYSRSGLVFGQCAGLPATVT